MKVTLKAILFIVIAIALAVLGGYIWGAAGRWRALRLPPDPAGAGRS